MGFIIIYVTHESYNEAKKVGQKLLEDNLIACANYFPITSSFMWQGEVKEENEYVSLFKTSKDNWGKIKEKINLIHPYDTPAIIKFEVEANQEFSNWIEEETN